VTAAVLMDRTAMNSTHGLHARISERVGGGLGKGPAANCF
jgi:hypothetical protein